MSWENADEVFFAMGLLFLIAGYLSFRLMTKSKANKLGDDIQTIVFLTTSIAFLTPLL
jgi:hypothetical protein